MIRGVRLHGNFWWSAFVGLAALAMLAAPGEASQSDGEREAMLSTLQAYIAAVYARDYATAYGWIAAADRQLKSVSDYEQDNDPFKGTSLALARRLAREIVLQESRIDRDAQRAQLWVLLSLPNANAEDVSRLLLAEDGATEAPGDELHERMAALEALIDAGQVPRVEIEQSWTLVRDPEGWRVFLDWGSGVRIQFVTRTPEGLGVSAAFDRVEVLTPRGEAVQLRLTVQNESQETLRLKVLHRVDPAPLEKRLDLVQCGYLFTRRVAPGDTDESPVTYFVDEDLPKEVDQLRVTLEFVAVE